MIDSAYTRYLVDNFFTNGIAVYVKILPKGIYLEGTEIFPEMKGQILSFGPARTRYADHRMVCHSANAIDAPDAQCSCCRKRKDCTVQMRLDLIHHKGILRFMLSCASLRNFMLFLSKLKQQGISPKGALITITVLNRGRWGELKFSFNRQEVLNEFFR
jgi:hypothetical protein